MHLIMMNEFLWSSLQTDRKPSDLAVTGFTDVRTTKYLDGTLPGDYGANQLCYLQHVGAAHQHVQ